MEKQNAQGGGSKSPHILPLPHRVGCKVASWPQTVYALERGVVRDLGQTVLVAADRDSCTVTWSVAEDRPVPRHLDRPCSLGCLSTVDMK